MKFIIYTGLIVFCLIFLSLVGLSLASRKVPQRGVVDGQLIPCHQLQNCVCSEDPHSTAFIPPLNYSIAHEDAWQSVKQAVISTGGEIMVESGHYLQAIYVTPLFRFIDDLELRLDEDQHLIQVRSASRVGYSDLGTNRRRVESLRHQFKSN